jgi:hypothetical protein
LFAAGPLYGTPVADVMSDCFGHPSDDTFDPLELCFGGFFFVL